jgi:hypothetical protein
MLIEAFFSRKMLAQQEGICESGSAISELSFADPAAVI